MQTDCKCTITKDKTENLFSFQQSLPFVDERAFRQITVCGMWLSTNCALSHLSPEQKYVNTSKQNFNTHAQVSPLSLCKLNEEKFPATDGHCMRHVVSSNGFLLMSVNISSPFLRLSFFCTESCSRRTFEPLASIPDLQML